MRRGIWLWGDQGGVAPTPIHSPRLCLMGTALLKWGAVRSCAREARCGVAAGCGVRSWCHSLLAAWAPTLAGGRTGESQGPREEKTLQLLRVSGGSRLLLVQGGARSGGPITAPSFPGGKAMASMTALGQGPSCLSSAASSANAASRVAVDRRAVSGWATGPAVGGVAPLPHGPVPGPGAVGGEALSVDLLGARGAGRAQGVPRARVPL